MKKYKLLAVLMTIIIVFASMPGQTIHADSISMEAQACKNLGILTGADKSGVTAEYLSQAPTRLTAYIIALRLKGLYEKAGNFTSNTNFTDASAAGWAKNYLAYAKNTPELGWGGYPNGSFGVNDKISGQAFYKVMLETLGYKQNVDFTYAQTLEFADKIGLIEDAGEIAAIKSFTINDIAKGIYGALNTNVAGTDKKFATLLVEKGVFKAEKVEAVGLDSLIQIPGRLDLEYEVAMVPIRDTFIKMGGYIIENDNTNMDYGIRKDKAYLRLIEGFTTAYINNTKVTLERPIMKDSAGIYYVPVSFILTSAREFGYDAEYIKAQNILKLQKLGKVKAVEREIVLTKGEKKYLKVEKTYSDIQTEIITNQCSYTVKSNDSIVLVGSTSGEVTGKNIGSAEIIISYQGKEVDRVTAHVVDVVPKYYSAAYYEQVFDTTFRLDKPNLTDGFGAIWNKGRGVIAQINEDDSIDTGSSLNILNYSESESGVTVDLTKLLEERAIRGKTSILGIYVKGVSEGSKLYATLNVRTASANFINENSVVLDSVWKSIQILKVVIPEDAEEMTLNIEAGHNDEIRIDAFTMTLN